MCFKIIFLSDLKLPQIIEGKGPVCFCLNSKSLDMCCLWYFFQVLLRKFFQGTHTAPGDWDHVFSFYNPDF